MTSKYVKNEENFDRLKSGDYYCYCDICGCRFWASQATILTTTTGRGGAIVCPEDADPIDYGLVPYTVPAEKNVPFARDTVYSNNPGIFQTNLSFQANKPQDYVDFGWWNTPQTNTTSYLTWDQLNLQTWDQFTLLWGVGNSNTGSN